MRLLHFSQEEAIHPVVSHRRLWVVEIMLYQALEFLLGRLLGVSLGGEGADAFLGNLVVEAGEDIDEVNESLFCNLLVFQLGSIRKLIVVPVVLAEVSSALFYAAQRIRQRRVGECILCLSIQAA